MKPHGGGNYPHRGGSEGHTEVEENPHEGGRENHYRGGERKVFIVVFSEIGKIVRMCGPVYSIVLHLNI